MGTEERIETISALAAGLLLGGAAAAGVLALALGPAHVPGFRLLPLWMQAGLTHTPLPGGEEAPPVYWYLSRAAGLLAYGTLWASTVWGLVMTSKVLDRLVPRPVSFGLHQFLATLALSLTGLHMAALLGDRYFDFTLGGLLVPGRSPFKPLWVGLGVVAFYVLVAVYGSFAVRKRIGQRTWRALHSLSFALYLLALAHGLMAGTDLGHPPAARLYLASAGVVLFLSYSRILAWRQRPQRPDRPAARAATPSSRPHPAGDMRTVDPG
ncbi:MAG: hypothetical protein M5U01_14230 [Ardenticatenaceae bacterium]|nr:hypothetical protein [Ardenticatenaceae bacterium]